MPKRSFTRRLALAPVLVALLAVAPQTALAGHDDWRHGRHGVIVGDDAREALRDRRDARRAFRREWRERLVDDREDFFDRRRDFFDRRGEWLERRRAWRDSLRDHDRFDRHAFGRTDRFDRHHFGGPPRFGRHGFDRGRFGYGFPPRRQFFDHDHDHDYEGWYGHGGGYGGYGGYYVDPPRPWRR